jgi:transporter family-2 protein
MTKWPYFLAAIAVGASIALQPALNADVARRIGTSIGATILSVTVAFLCAAAFAIAVRPHVSLTAVASLPWYLWIAGVIGFIFVAAGIYVAPVLGGAAFFASIVAGQLIMATVADMIGVGGYQAQGFDIWRIVGVVLVVAGVMVFQKAA